MDLPGLQARPVLRVHKPDRQVRPGRRARLGRRAIQVPYPALQDPLEAKELLATQALPALRAWPARLDRKVMLALPAQRGRKEILDLLALKGISARLVLHPRFRARQALQGPPEAGVALFRFMTKVRY